MSIPNLLTLLRIGVVPFFILVAYASRSDWAFYLFLAAGITDALDGIIARVFHQKTILGAFLDPVADKLLMTSSFIVLAMPHAGLEVTIPPGLSFLVILRDMIIAMCVLFIFLKNGLQKFPPSVLGKVSTIIQISYVVEILCINNWPDNAFFQFMNMPLMWGTLALTLASGFHYMAIVAKGGLSPSPEPAA